MFSYRVVFLMDLKTKKWESGKINNHLCKGQEGPVSCPEIREGGSSRLCNCQNNSHDGKLCSGNWENILTFSTVTSFTMLNANNYVVLDDV